MPPYAHARRQRRGHALSRATGCGARSTVRDGVARIVDGLVDRSQTDPRISDIFKGQDMVRLRRTLKEQFCYILGGGCAYSGRTMTAAHTDMGVQVADMAALVEHLQIGDAERRASPFAAQNRFLAKLAPMHRTIVKR